MMTLKPEHIAPYLPHSLKVILEGKKTNIAWISTKYIAVIVPDSIGEIKRIKWEYAHLNVKLILKPLSELDLETIREMTGDYGSIDFKIDDEDDDVNIIVLDRLKWSSTLTFKEYLKLFEYHFDVSGLIEKGLAVKMK